MDISNLYELGGYYEIVAAAFGDFNQVAMWVKYVTWYVPVHLLIH